MDQLQFQKAHQRLYSELVSLQSQWDEYSEMFASGEDRVSLLNRCGSWFFGMVQRVFARDIIAGIYRLTEPARSGKKARLCLETLLQDPRMGSNPGLESELRDRIGSLRLKAKPFIEHRHQYVGHLNVALATGAAKISPIPRQLLNEVLAEMQSIFRRHGHVLDDADRMMDIRPMRPVRRVIELLELGEQAEKAKFEAKVQSWRGAID